MKRTRKTVLMMIAGLALVSAGAVGAGRALHAGAEGRRAALLVGELYAGGEGILPAHSRAGAREIFEELGALVGARVRERADTNADGALDAQELATARARAREVFAKLRAVALARFDRDADGALSSDERAQIRELVRGRIAGARAGADTDADGRLSDEEIRAAAKLAPGDAERERTLKAAGLGALLTEEDRARARGLVAELAITVRAGVMENFDADKDGALSEPERAALRERASARAGEIRAAAVGAGDTDGDGSLGADERRALAARMIGRWLGLAPGAK